MKRSVAACQCHNICKTIQSVVFLGDTAPAIGRMLRTTRWVVITAPTRIDCEHQTKCINLRGFNPVEASEEHRLLKWNAAQKRQDQRDSRRHYTNPYRTQEEEYRERWRKHIQGENRHNSRVDPYEPEHGGHAYVHHRENGKNWKNNHYSNPHWYPY
eukprot:CCRYP_001058-RB/>CCRYP_001058-RB protein AED:0.11 eAED:0.11 QI:1614/0.5/1/1/0.5/0.33/3/219/156